MPEPINANTAGDTKAAIEAGAAAAKLEDRLELVEGDGPEVPLVLVPNGMRLEVPTAALAESDRRAQHPARTTGTATHQELDSFIAHLNRFKGDHSVVWADPATVQLTAVINYATASQPRWGDHQSTYACPLSREWQLWMGAANRAFGQDDFAEFLEANQPDLVGPGQDEELSYPQPTYLLQLARFLRINAKSTYERSTNPTTGEASLVAKTEQELASTRIPPVFLIGIAVFEAGVKYRVEARLRLQFREGRPYFSFHFPLAEAVKRDAFGEVRERVAKETGLPVYAGSPE